MTMKYTTPKLTPLGSISELTLGRPGSGVDAGTRNSKNAPGPK